MPEGTNTLAAANKVSYLEDAQTPGPAEPLQALCQAPRVWKKQIFPSAEKPGGLYQLWGCLLSAQGFRECFG